MELLVFLTLWIMIKASLPSALMGRAHFLNASAKWHGLHNSTGEIMSRQKYTVGKVLDTFDGTKVSRQNSINPFMLFIRYILKNSPITLR